MIASSILTFLPEFARPTSAPPRSSRTPHSPRSRSSSRTKGSHSAPSRGSLEEITNQIFEDLMRGKSQVAHGFDELGVLELGRSNKVVCSAAWCFVCVNMCYYGDLWAIQLLTGIILGLQKNYKLWFCLWTVFLWNENLFHLDNFLMSLNLLESIYMI